MADGYVNMALIDDEIPPLAGPSRAVSPGPDPRCAAVADGARGGCSLLSTAGRLSAFLFICVERPLPLCIGTWFFFRSRRSHSEIRLTEMSDSPTLRSSPRFPPSRLLCRISLSQMTSSERASDSSSQNTSKPVLVRFRRPSSSAPDVDARAVCPSVPPPPCPSAVVEPNQTECYTVFWPPGGCKLRFVAVGVVVFIQPGSQRRSTRLCPTKNVP